MVYIAESEYRDIIADFERHPDRDYWTADRIEAVAERMMRAVANAYPAGAPNTVRIDGEQWQNLANDLRKAKHIAPGQWANEVGRTIGP